MIKQYPIARDDAIYECFPDIAAAPDGTLVCVYRESAHHADLNNSRLVFRRSADGGRHWSEKTALTPVGTPVFAYNCPRVSTLPDGSMAILCDIFDRRAESADSRVFLYHGGHPLGVRP